LLNAAANSNIVSQTVSAGVGGAFLRAYGASVPCFGVVVADFNQDGKADLAIRSILEGGLDVELGNGDGTFQRVAHVDIRKDSFYTVIAVGDFNSDGKTDLAALHSRPRAAGATGTSKSSRAMAMEHFKVR
jgi:hypothetical protein